jgi:hypothetical protein
MARSIVQISGHIIDSLLLPKILDLIITLCAEFEILEIQIGHRRADRSYAQIQIDAPTPAILERVLAKIKEHGALPVDTEEEAVELQPAPADAVGVRADASGKKGRSHCCRPTRRESAAD